MCLRWIEQGFEVEKFKKDAGEDVSQRYLSVGSANKCANAKFSFEEHETYESNNIEKLYSPSLFPKLSRSFVRYMQ